MTSVGVDEMLLGQLMQLSPSPAAVAPIPPLKKKRLENGFPASSTPHCVIDHSGEPAIAITRSGMTCARAERARLGMKWPVSARDATGAG